MATLNTVKVKGDQFEPASQHGSNGDTVPFKNKRGSTVRVTLDPTFFSQGTLDLTAEGSSGDSGTVTIIGTSGTGPFKAPKKSAISPKQGDDDIKGEIIIRPNK